MSDENSSKTEELKKQLEIAKEIERLAGEEGGIENLLKKIELQKEYNEALKNEQHIQENISEYGETLDATKIRLQQDLLKNTQNYLHALREVQEADEENLEAAKDLLQQQLKAKETTEENLNSVINLIDAKKESADLDRELKKQAKNLGVEYEKLSDKLNEISEAGGGFGAVLEDAFGDTPGIIGDIFRQAKRLKGSLGTAGLELQKVFDKYPIFGKHLGFISEGLVNISRMPIGKLFTPVAIALAIAQIGRMALQVNNLSKQIGAATGFGDVFNGQIVKMAAAGHMAGIGFQEAANSIKAMTEGLSSFNPTAEKTNQYVGLTIARLEKLGVSSASSVKSIDHMQRSMGLSAEAAADMTAQIARMGKEVGITGTKMLEQFNSASGRLAIYGKNNVKVFKELAAQAKATGIEMGTLISISEKFDKFDSAADSAAQLNAVLGTQLSTLEMMNATDSERVMMLKQQVQMSVGNFDSLDKFTKQYIAQAMGVKDVAEAQRLLNMSTAEYQKYQQGQKESADIQKEIADASAEIVPVMQQLKLAAMQFFMAFSPLIESFAEFLSFISPFIVMAGKAIGMLGYLAGAAGTVYLAVKLLAGGMALFMAVSQIGLIIAAVSGLVWALNKLWDIIHKPGSPSMASGLFGVIGESIAAFGSMIMSPINMVSGLASSFGSLFESLHPKETGMNFEVEALAKMDTSKVASGFKQIKSALMDLSTLKVDGFLAMKTDGTSSSFIMGSEGDPRNTLLP